MRQLVNELKVDTPLYFALVDYSFLKYPFIMPPQPGLIAWIQRLHTIDITHKSSLYICTSEAHTKMAQCAGLKTFKAKTVLNNPKIVTAVNCRTRQPAVPACVSEPQVCYYENTILPSGLELESRSTAPCTRPSPQIPLLDKARDSRKEKEMSCIATEIAMGRCHGVCFKNLEMLEKYQEKYQKSASPTDAVLCTPFKPDCVESLVPSESADQQNMATTVPVLATDKQQVDSDTSLKTELQTSKSDGKTVVSLQCENETMQGSSSHCIKIDPDDIEKLALSESRYKKGKAILHLIKDLVVTPDDAEDLLQITSTCIGSQGQNYEVFAVIGNDGVTKAKCSCVDAAGQTGQCKHVVAMLLKYVDKDEQTTESIKHTKTFTRKRKSSKRNAGWQNTLYVMSSQELLETANQILREHDQSHKDKTENDKEAEISSHKANTSRELSREEKNAESSSDTSTTRQQDSYVEDKDVNVLEKSSSRCLLTENSKDMNEEQPDISCSLHGESKRQRTSYGLSILDELI